MEITAPIPRSAFYILAALGTYCTWGRAVLDGSLRHLFVALHGPEHYVLPGTKHLLRKSFTGIYWPIDYLLDILVIFFWEAIDGSHPATSVIGIYFMGQYFCVLALLYLDSSRKGNTKKNGLFRITIWLVVFQMTAIGCTGGVWALSYLSSSPLTKAPIAFQELQNASLAPADRTALIAPSLVIGYVCTAVWMALPSPQLVSNGTQQIALVIWNIFPIAVFLTFKLLGAFTSSPLKAASSARSHMRAVRFVYAVSATIGTIVHIGIATMSLSTLLFPAIFSPLYLEELHPRSLALPPVFFTEGNTVGDGVRSFFIWDQVFGYIVAGLIMLSQYRAVCFARAVSPEWRKTMLEAVITTLVAGPGVACLLIGWRREEMLFGEKEEAERLKRK